MRLLVTKKCSPSFKDRIVQLGLTLIEYPLIRIEPLPVQIEIVESSLIFTSQNAVKLAFESKEISALLHGKNCYCVGEKTKALLEKNGQKVLKMHQNASDLAHFLVKKVKNDSFSFFCGKQRRTEIEDLLGREHMKLKIHELYETHFSSKVFENHFDGILFFSPSAVQSFFSKNHWNKHTHGFCIGTSTARALQQYTSSYNVAKTPSENHLLLEIQNYYTHHYVKK